MAAKTQTDEPREATMADLMAMFARTLEQQTAVLGKLGDNQKPYEPGFGDPAYQASLEAQGFKDEFAIPVYQNGRPCEARKIPLETRERVVALRPGTYLKNKVKDGVIVERTDKLVHLRYRSQKVEERMVQPWRSFEELVDLVWTEMQAVPA